MNINTLFTPPPPTTQEASSKVIALTPEQEKELIDEASKADFIRNFMIASAAAALFVDLFVTINTTSKAITRKCYGDYFFPLSKR